MKIIHFFCQIPVLLPRLEAIEKNVYDPCTYCKYKPGEEEGGAGGKKGGGAGGKRGGGGGRKTGGGGGKKNGGGGGKKSGGSGGGGSSAYSADIAAGKIPGQAGQDYPAFSLAALGKKGNFKVEHLSSISIPGLLSL